MPNHIKNQLELIGSLTDIDSLIAEFSTTHPSKVEKTHDGLVICKHKIEPYNYCWLDLSNGHVHNREGLNQIGMPDYYEISLSDSFVEFPDFSKIIPPPNTPAYRDEPSQDIAKESPDWWYTWNIKHWGTKWGAYSCERTSINVFSFETAWSSVPKIIDIISKKHPNVTIKYTWADEDTAPNCGKRTYHNGLLEEYLPEGGSKEAYEIAFEVRPDNAKNYALVDGKYTYLEND